VKHVRIVHLGDTYWLVREEATGPVFSFNPEASYRPLGFAAQRPWLSPGDLIEVDEADLQEANTG